MTDEFMKRLTPIVADLLPVHEGESFDDYCVRVRAEPVLGRRAMIAACIGEFSDGFRQQHQERKTEWITAARLAFDPGPRQPCAVCGKYVGLAEAHHILPLAMQFDAGASSPIQDFDWLCPTHHAAQHAFIDQFRRNVTSSIPGLPPDESDALHCLNGKLVELLLRLPNWRRSIR